MLRLLEYNTRAMLNQVCMCVQVHVGGGGGVSGCGDLTFPRKLCCPSPSTHPEYTCSNTTLLSTLVYMYIIELPL